jgi:aconitate hydratase
MGVLPLEFPRGQNAASLGLTGAEEFFITGIADGLMPAGEVVVEARRPDGTPIRFDALVRIDTPEELAAFKAGGILPYVLRQLARR